MATEPIAVGDDGGVVRQKINAAITVANVEPAARAAADALIYEQVGQNFNVISKNVSTAYNNIAAETLARTRADEALLRAAVSLAPRPGAAPSHYTNSFAGGLPEALPVLPDSLVATGDRGAVVRIVGAGIVASRDYVAVEPGRTFRVRAAVQRRVDTPDPAGDAVRVGIAWYDRNLDPLTTTATSTLNDYTALTVGSGRVSLFRVLAGAAGAGVDVVAPAGALFFRIYVETWGTTAATDIEVLACEDITDVEGWSPDVSALEGDVAALQSLDIGNRLTTIEAALGTPDSLTFPTLGDFAAADIGASPDAVRVLGADAPHDGQGSYWQRADAGTGTRQSADGAYWREVRFQRSWHVYSPFDYGGIGDGVADDTEALQAAIDALRNDPATLAEPLHSAKKQIDLRGGVWKHTDTLNATDIQCWGGMMVGGVLYGNCTGKPMVDFTGARGLSSSTVHFHGDKENRPSRAWQGARSTVTRACDFIRFDHCQSTGYFSDMIYCDHGMESHQQNHCKWFNYDPAGRLAAIQGFDTFPCTSEFTTPMTGPVSCIHKHYPSTCWMYVGVDGAPISAVTNDTACVLTTTYEHSFEVGDTVVFFTFGGMRDVMDKAIAEITEIDGNDITVDFDTTGAGTYTGGGTLFKAQDHPSLYICRTQGVHIDCGYLTAFGQPHIEIGFPDASFTMVSDLKLDLLMEGVGNRVNIEVDPGALACTMDAFSLRTYNAAATEGVFGVKAGAAGSVSIGPIQISATRTRFAIPLVRSGDAIGIYGGSILFDSTHPTAFAQVGGGLYTGPSGKMTAKNIAIFDTRNSDTTPAVAPNSGAFAALGACTLFCTYHDAICVINLDLAITTNGTAAGSLRVTMPFTAARACTFSGWDSSTGVAVIGLMTTGSSTLVITRIDNSYPGADGTRILMSGPAFVLP
ncbi:glycoside hydrolase family 55 protein [Ancylobacter mangrovi]|uniref:glycoside hydrolase family 55 protein n=1 Tax=Ancylobacter mangrovi TaxID=2972472 RepID=UPI0021638A03|nr:glycoside hydrolase family 55 protein [Ancylobacter mangrovi]MCS0501630.1 glycoside hydrolase family 55 protein [Ancylobacter mangrovi]